MFKEVSTLFNLPAELSEGQGSRRRAGGGQEGGVVMEGAEGAAVAEGEWG